MIGVAAMIELMPAGRGIDAHSAHGIARGRVAGRMMVTVAWIEGGHRTLSSA
jgi:hypothetical protein